MKNFVTKYAAYIIIAVMLVMLIPGITNRISNEEPNNNVTISVLYDQLKNNISGEKLDSVLDEFKKAGVNTVSIGEEDLNLLVNRGDLTSIRYNVLRHKYDDESMAIADLIAEKCPDISYSSHVIIASRDRAKEQLAYALPRKYSEAEYADVGEFDDLHIYVLYDGRRELYDYTIGYNEDTLKKLKADGFDIALVYKVKNYSTVTYLEDIERLVKEYDVEYLNLKENEHEYTGTKKNEKNYTILSDIINRNNMTLVVTENVNQLSNQKFLGYTQVFNKTMDDGGSQKVVRSYETYDNSQQDESKYEYRVEQFLNSTIDRNIRFITVTPLTPDFTSYEASADFTLKAVKAYKEKIEGLGYTVNQGTTPLNYRAHHTLNAALCAVLMIMCVLLMYNMITGKKSFALTVAAIILSAAAFAGTAIIPDSLVALYPTVFCVVQSCTAMTVMLYFIKTCKDKLPSLALTLGSVVILLAVLLLGAVALCSMLSGIEYYINNAIFRGIKISLIVPIIYTAIVYYFMFMKNSGTSVFGDLKKALNAEIKVYWMIIAVCVAAVGIYYLIRSGNVSDISGIEKAMRSAVTELFPARPRTKEFLIGYPALVLFVYYMKHHNIQLLKWLLAIAASILAASITNSFCHIFTNFLVIVSRTLNGLTLGIIISVVAYIANIVLIKAVTLIKNRL